MSSPASATIPPPAAIYESNTPSQDTKVSDVSIDNDNNDTSNINKDEGSGDDGSNGKETEDAAFHRAAREIMCVTETPVRVGRLQSRDFNRIARASSTWSFSY